MLSSEALSFRQQSRLAISLSWIGGFIDVFSFLTWKIFTSHMTGASSTFGFSAASADRGKLLVYGILLSSFLAGAVASSLMTELSHRRGVLSKYMLPLTVEAGILLSLMLALPLLSLPAGAKLGLPQAALLGLTAFAMGLQNATITRISGAVVRVTHVTGVITDLGIETVQFLLWAWDQLRGRIWRRAGRVLKVSQRHPAFLRLTLLASIWCSFVFGAIISVLAYRHLHERSLLLPIGFLLLITLLDWKQPIADIRELDVLHDPELKLHGIVHALLPPHLGLYRMTHGRSRHFRTPSFSFWIDNLPPHKQVAILALSPLLRFNANAIADLKQSLAKLQSTRRRLIIAGVTPAQYKRLAHDHLVDQIGPENICPDLEFAIALGTDLSRRPKR